MSSVLLRGLLVAMFLALSTTFIISQNLHRERILIVNGADPASGFTRRVDYGLRRVFRNVENRTIRWDYMGTEAAADLTTEARLGEVERRRVEKFGPTVIIAVGDDALEYVGKVYADRPGVSVVFTAISGNLAQYGFTGTSNVTGITMSTPYAAARDTLIAANGSRRTHPIQRIFHLTVDRGSYERWEQGIQRFDWAPLQLVGSRTVATFDDWKAAVVRADSVSDAIVTGLHEGLRRSKADPSLASAHEIVQWTETHSSIPVLGLDASFAENGGLVAVGPSPYEEGQVAAEFALAILNRHVPAASLGTRRRSEQYVVALRRRAMKKRHFELPEVYWALAQASDQSYE
jgi:hypothetical protein